MLNDDGVEGIAALGKDVYYCIGEFTWNGVTFEAQQTRVVLDDAKIKSTKYGFPVTNVTTPSSKGGVTPAQEKRTLRSQSNKSGEAPRNETRIELSRSVELLLSDLQRPGYEHSVSSATIVTHAKELLEAWDKSKLGWETNNCFAETPCMKHYTHGKVTVWRNGSTSMACSDG